MKKSVLAVLAACTLLAFASCGKAPAPAETEAEPERDEIIESDGTPSGAIELPLIDPDN